MQSVKLFMRQVGVSNPMLDVKGVGQVEEEIAYQFPDYELKDTHYLGDVRNDSNQVVGYKVLFVFVKNVETRQADETKAKAK